MSCTSSASKDALGSTAANDHSDAQRSASAAQLSRSITFVQFILLILGAALLLLPSHLHSLLRSLLLFAMPTLFLWMWRLLSSLNREAVEVIDAWTAAAAVSPAGGPPVLAPSGAICSETPAKSRASETLSQLIRTPSMPPLATWGEPLGETFSLRSRSYLRTRVKQPSIASLFELVALDCFAMEDPADRFDIATRSDHWLRSERGSEDEDGPFTLLLNIVIPSANNLCLVAYFRPRVASSLKDLELPEVRLFWDWVEGSDAFRNERLKLIPRVAKGSFLVQKGVGATPVLLGKKIKVHYFRTPRTFEVDLDVGSDPVANGVCRLVRDVMASSVCLDLAIALEGRFEQELPERMLGALRCEYMDFRTCAVPTPPRPL